MKKTSYTVLNMLLLSLIPAVAGAAGTYYNGLGYQKNQAGYYGKYSNARGANYANRSMNNYAQSRGGAFNAQQSAQKSMKSGAVQKGQATSSKQGFVLGANLTHEFARWDFSMKTAGSELYYDNLDWNVLGVEGTYYFTGSTPVQIKVGGRYGKQFGESAMIDDDISNGGYLNTSWEDGSTGDVFAYQTGHALSAGSSKDGTQMGFNVSLGLTDFFNLGKVKITPSIGYRYLKYELTTKKNKGVAIDILDSTSDYPYVTCIVGYKGEIQCDPFLLFVSSGGQVTTTGRVEVDENGDGTVDGVSDNIQVPVISGFTVAGVNTGGTYYYEQSGTSHKYETEWYGPYLALDFEYNIDKDNLVNAGIEFGLPMYRSVGDQPYRFDWEHPKSVEDKGDFGDAYHIGLNANWTTAITDSTSLVLGMTYDYYSVSDATATTYKNASYYTELYDIYTNALDNNVLTDYEREVLETEVANIEEDMAANWAVKDENEIKSIYKAMGIRVGLNIKF